MVLPAPPVVTSAFPFLMLPTGQVLFTDSNNTQLYVYTGAGPVAASSTPSISGITSDGGSDYTLNGSALNGPNEGATYGDDAQMATNYPIVSVEDPLSEALIQGTIATRPAFIEVFLDGNKLFYRPVDAEKTEGVLLYEN